MVKNVTRGGQTVSQNVSMFGQVFGVILNISIITFLIVLSMYVYFNIQQGDIYHAFKHLECSSQDILGQIIGFDDVILTKTVVYHDKSVELVTLRSFLQKKGSLNRVVEAFRDGVSMAVIVSFLTSMISVVYLKKRGKTISNERWVRGAKLATPSELKKNIKRKYGLSDFKVAGLPLPKHSENQHIVIYGSTGTGKSQLFYDFLSQIRKKEDRAIVYDYTKDYISRFYNPETDILLNPLDERCPYWDIWQECRSRSDFDAMAESLIPEQSGKGDPFWVEAARIVFSATAYKMANKNPTTSELLKALLSVDYEQIKPLVKGTEAEILTSDKQDKLALSVKAILAAHLRSLQYLPDKGKKFSIRDWVSNQENQGWLFISSGARESNALKPLITTILDQSSKSAQELPKYSGKNLFYVFDEQNTLGKLPSYLSTLSLGRKHCVSMISGWQSPAQLMHTYGQDYYKSICDNMNTAGILRMKSHNSAKELSNFLGEQEVEVSRENISYGITDNRSGVNYSKDRIIRPLVLPSEIQLMDDLEIYLSLKGNLPVTRTKVPIINLEEIQPEFIPREIKMDREIQAMIKKVEVDANNAGVLEETSTNIIVEQEAPKEKAAKEVDYAELYDF